MHHAMRHANVPPTGNKITRLSCAFEGCQMPPAVTPSSRRHLCFAHAKQRSRGQELRPYTPRSDPDKAWTRWAERRAARCDGSGLKLRHAGACGGALRVHATNPNGVRGKRSCICTKCLHYVQVMPDGSMYRTGRVHAHP